MKEEIAKAAKRAKAVLVVEMSLGQMVEDVERAVAGACPVYFYGRTGGGIPSQEEIEKRAIGIASGKTT